MSLNRDGDGFLVDFNDWTEDIMFEMAKEDDFEITDEIRTYIMTAREMFNATGTVPAVRVFAKEFGMNRKASKLYEVFQSGPMKKIAKYGGLPKPTGCVWNLVKKPSVVHLKSHKILDKTCFNAL